MPAQMRSVRIASDLVIRPLTRDSSQRRSFLLTAIWKAYQDLSKPVLIHCSAGLDRTGSAVEYIQRRLKDPD